MTDTNEIKNGRNQNSPFICCPKSEYFKTNIIISVCISESIFYSNGKVVTMRWLVFAIIVTNPALLLPIYLYGACFQTISLIGLFTVSLFGEHIHLL